MSRFYHTIGHSIVIWVENRLTINIT